MAKSKIALYGNVAIPRTYCDRCETSTLVIGGIRQCCDMPDSDLPSGFVQMVQPDCVRKAPSPTLRKSILARQDGACIYCGSTFGSWVRRGARIVKLNPEWDHFVPWAYARDNSSCNFVAACDLCNRIKGTMMFQTVEDAAAYIRTKVDLRFRESRKEPSHDTD